MGEGLLKEIRKDLQIRKFCAYGFLKNLKFFEPYLLFFLMGKGISLFEIGILIAVRAAVVNLFEIPSGFFADYCGRKRELCLCFLFYIASFICFYFTRSFLPAVIAMVFFGLGEAFRSGTHKAMIYTYLDSKGWRGEKTFVYGRTRSFSLMGSAVSALAGIAIVLQDIPLNTVFLFSIIPYLLDFFLILSYPGFLDCADRDRSAGVRAVFKNFTGGFKRDRVLRNLLLEEGMFEATISFIKDLIQPMLETIVIGSGVVIMMSLSAEDNLKIILGIVYAVLNLFGSFSSGKAYILKSDRSNTGCLYLIHLLLAVCMAALAVVSRNPFAVFAIYLVIYLLFNVRKPVFVDEVDEHIDRSTRATVFSVASQLKSLFLIIFAPALGFIADCAGIRAVMAVLSFLFLVTLPFLRTGKKSR